MSCGAAESPFGGDANGGKMAARRPHVERPTLSEGKNMSRRYSLMVAGVVLGAMLAMLGLYLSQSRAGDGGAANAGTDPTVTISERELKSLMQRLSDLESRVKALEYNGIVLVGPPAPKAIHPSVPLTPTWPSDGFGPVRTIPADSHNR